MKIEIHFNTGDWESFSIKSDYVPRVGETFSCDDWSEHVSKKTAAAIDAYCDNGSLFVSDIFHRLKGGKLMVVMILMEEKHYQMNKIRK